MNSKKLNYNIFIPFLIVICSTIVYALFISFIVISLQKIEGLWFIFLMLSPIIPISSVIIFQLFLRYIGKVNKNASDINTIQKYCYSCGARLDDEVPPDKCSNCNTNLNFKELIIKSESMDKKFNMSKFKKENNIKLRYICTYIFILLIGIIMSYWILVTITKNYYNLSLDLIFNLSVVIFFIFFIIIIVLAPIKFAKDYKNYKSDIL